MQILIDNAVVYSPGYQILIGDETKALYYYFDYDKREAATQNMEFQHFHRFYEMCILLDEQAGHLIDGVFYNIRCCDIVLLRPGLLHKTAYPEGTTCKRLIIQFAIPELTGPLAASLAEVNSVFNAECPIYRFEDRLKEQILGKLNNIYYLAQSRAGLSESEKRGDDPALNLRITANMLEFLSLLYQNRQRNIYANRTNFDTLTAKIYDITAYIHSHYTEDLTLDSIASAFYLSNSYLSHQFKRITGFTVTDYIQMTRVRNAQSLLLSTELPITEIAFASGFSSFSQFNRVFHKFQMESPTSFRKNRIPLWSTPEEALAAGLGENAAATRGQLPRFDSHASPR